MADVSNTIRLPDGTTPSHATVEIELVASTTRSAAGWVSASDVALLSVVRPTVTNGSWTAALTPNADIDPSGTVYRVTECADRREYVSHIRVTADGGSLHDLLADPPASLASAASEAYADAAVAALAATVAASIPVDEMDGADDDAKFAAALALWDDYEGATEIVFAARTYTLADQWVIPNDGASPPNQKSLIIRGAGGGHHGGGGVPLGGTILNFTNQDGPAKIDSRGHGLLALRDLTFRDASGGDNPFIQVTNTTLICTGVEFYGSKSGQACDQDAIILGGGTRDIDGTVTAKFDGYGTVISQCYFNRVRRAVWLRPGSNGVIIRDNVIWVGCGAPDATYGAIQLTGFPATSSSLVGNVIDGNIIEMNNYPVGILLEDWAKVNSITNNGLYDPSGVRTEYGIYCDDNAEYNTIIAGYSDDSFPYLGESAASTGKNTLLTNHQSQVSQISQPWEFVGSTALKFKFPGSAGPRLYDVNETGNYWDTKGNATNIPELQFRYNGTAELAIRSKHLLGKSTAPTVAAKAAFGSGPSITVTGTDLGGRIAATSGTGGGLAAGDWFDVLFSAVYGSGRAKVVISPADAVTAALGAYAYSGATDRFTLGGSSAPAASTVYTWNYICVE